VSSKNNVSMSTHCPSPILAVKRPGRAREALVDSGSTRRLVGGNDRSATNKEGAMRYLCLIYDDEKRRGTMTKSEADAFTGEYFAFTDAIRKSGHYLAGEALEPVQSATTVRVRNGKLSTTDGPFAETKEQLGGFYLINARDLNDAIQVASKIPSARVGSVEVRPIMEFDQPKG
jgi:hypothetical protein